jgi:hypothetical protein
MQVLTGFIGAIALLTLLSINFGKSVSFNAAEMIGIEPAAGSDIDDSAGDASSDINGTATVVTTPLVNMSAKTEGEVDALMALRTELLVKRTALAAKVTSRELYPAQIGDFVHPFGTCDGHRGMMGFNFTEAFVADSLKTTGKEPRGFPYLHLMRRLYEESTDAAEKRRRNALGLDRGRVSNATTQPPQAAATGKAGRRTPDIIENALPPNATTPRGLVVLDYNSTYVANGTRVWNHLLPDRREAFATEHESCLYVMARMIAVFASIMEKYNLRGWFITHGTLLGAVRHGGFIPWDVDVDIVLPRSHLTLLRKVWRKEFPRDMYLQSEKTEPAFHMWIGNERGIRIKDRYSSFLDVTFDFRKKGKRIRGKPYHTGAHLDLIPMERKRKRSQLKVFHNFFSHDDIYPLSAVCFENMVLPAPRYVDKFLRELYGPNYMEAPKREAMFAPPGSNPCVAIARQPRSHWSLNWRLDGHAKSSASVPRDMLNNATARAGLDPVPDAPVLWPRKDPSGSFMDDFRLPYG